MGMENNDLLREQAKKLRQIADHLYTIKEESILSKEELIDINIELNNVTSELNSIESLITTSNTRLTSIESLNTTSNARLVDIDSATSFSAGYTGSRLITSASGTVTGQFRGFVVNANAVIATCLDKDSVSLMGSSAMNLTGNTLNQGIYMSVSETNWISSISVTSGSIVLYNR